MDKRRLNDAGPREWDSLKRDKDWYKQNEDQPWEGFFKGRASAAFVPQSYEECVTGLREVGREDYVAGPQNAAGNPKARVGALKVPMHLLPPVALAHLAIALGDGNYREEGINVSTYIGALQRHLLAYSDREDICADSGVHHLAAIMAGCSILLDSAAVGKLVDDRPAPSGAAQILEDYHSGRKV